MGRVGIKIDIIGKKFGKLTVIKVSDRKEKQYFYDCQCDCGNLKTVRGSELKRGTTKSCGCLTYKHGEYGTKLNRIWNGVKQRCLNPNVTAFKNYGGRGISICDEWRESFEAFRDWSFTNGYVESMVQLDRRDNNGNYCPENCRWVSRVVNCNNTRVNKTIEYNGEKTTLALLTRKLGLRHKYKQIWKRVKKGKSIEEALIF